MTQGSFRSEPRAPLRDVALYCTGVFLAVRVGLALLAVAAVAVVPANDSVDVPGWPAPPAEEGWSNAATAWERWDALWFLRIAEDGYIADDGSAAFFPAYPLAVRGLSVVIGGHPLGAALIISNLALLGALIVVYLLTRHEFDDATARRTVLYMAIFPTAFFFFAPYSESLFLLFAATAVLCARRGRWAGAAAAGALATATRSIGLVLVAALVVEAISQARSLPRQRRARFAAWSLGCSVFAAAGAFTYLAYWRVREGDWLVPFSEQANWLRELAWPTSTAARGTGEAFKFIGVENGGYLLLDWGILVIALGLAVWVALRSRAVYVVYTWASLLVPLSFVFPGRPLMSLPRFALVVWPLFWALARLTLQRHGHELVVAASAAGLGVLTLLFVNWYWVF